jgi:hypothetical protein
VGYIQTACCISDVMVSVLDSSVIEHGLQKNCIGGVMISVLVSECDRSWVTENCIGGVIVSVLNSSVIDHGHKK